MKHGKVFNTHDGKNLSMGPVHGSPFDDFFSFYDSKLVPNYIISTAHCTGQSDEFLVNLEAHVTRKAMYFSNLDLLKDGYAMHFLYKKETY